MYSVRSGPIKSLNSSDLKFQKNSLGLKSPKTKGGCVVAGSPNSRVLHIYACVHIFWIEEVGLVFWRSQAIRLEKCVKLHKKLYKQRKYRLDNYLLRCTIYLYWIPVIYILRNYDKIDGPSKFSIDG